MRKRIFTTDHDCKCGGKGRRASTKDAVTASGFFTSEQLGPKQSLTPEGFLLCEEVPIARVGTQDYAYFELPDIEAKDGVIVVERTADVLFSPETLASFEGKPVTIDHPPDFVNPTNWSSVARGHAMNVRRGEGAQSDLMLADLLITDAEAIRRVQSKDLVEVSNGYDADYEQIAPGRARQVTVTGNHTALVKNARCGTVCSIGDSKPNFTPAGDSNMATKKPGQSSKFVDMLRKAFMTRDAEAFEKVASEMTGDEGGDDNGGEGDTHVHVHLNGAGQTAAAGAGTGGAGGDGGGDAGKAGDQDDPTEKILGAITALSTKFDGLEARVVKLEGGGDGTADDDPDNLNGGGEATTDENPDDNANGNGATAKTGDSAALRNEFQDAKSRAEILAPGVQLPTFDAKAERKKTVDALCVLRRRALRAALDGDNADLVKAVTGGADVTKMTCDSAKAFFNAASELVRSKNSGAGGRTLSTTDTGEHKPVDLNAIHREFWKNHK